MVTPSTAVHRKGSAPSGEGGEMGEGGGGCWGEACLSGAIEHSGLQGHSSTLKPAVPLGEEGGRKGERCRGEGRGGLAGGRRGRE